MMAVMLARSRVIKVSLMLVTSGAELSQVLGWSKENPSK